MSLIWLSTSNIKQNGILNQCNNEFSSLAYNVTLVNNWSLSDEHFIGLLML